MTQSARLIERETHNSDDNLTRLKVIWWIFYGRKGCFVVKPNNAAIIDKTFEYESTREAESEDLERQSDDQNCRETVNQSDKRVYQESRDTKRV